MKLSELREIKQITLTEWRKKASKMKNSYTDSITLLSDADKKLGIYHYVEQIPIRNFVIVYPLLCIEHGKDDDRIHTLRDAVIYRKADKKLERVDTEKMMLAVLEKVAPHVSVDEIIKDALYDLSPEDFDEIFERTVIKEGAVKEKPGCYKVLIGGKRGVPFELMLRE